MRLQVRRFILNFYGEYKNFVKTSEDKIFVSDHTDITSVGICGPERSTDYNSDYDASSVTDLGCAVTLLLGV